MASPTTLVECGVRCDTQTIFQFHSLAVSMQLQFDSLGLQGLLPGGAKQATSESFISRPQSHLCKGGFVEEVRLAQPSLSVHPVVSH